MATVRETIHRVIKGTEKSTGAAFAFEEPYVYYLIRSNRARIVERDMRANATRPSHFLFQTLPCVELEEVPIHECPCIPPMGCVVYRSKYKLPKPINGKYGDFLRSVMTLDGRDNISMTTWEAAKYQSGLKYGNNMAMAYIRNRYLYLTINPMEVEVVTVTGLFEDPVEAYDFPGICDDSDTATCDPPLDREFPADERLLDGIVAASIAELSGLAPKYPPGVRRVSQAESNDIT